MTTPEASIFDIYVPVYDPVPQEWEDASVFLTDRLVRYGNALNSRVSGFYTEEEILAGKNLFGGPTSGQTNQFRAIFRKVIDFGQLPNGTKTVLHGITITPNFQLVSLQGAASEPSTSFIPLPFSSSTLNENIKLEMDATRVIVTTAIDYTAYTTSLIVIEYVKEA